MSPFLGVIMGQGAMMWKDLFILKRCLLKCLGRGLHAHKLLFSSPEDTYIHVGVVNSTEIFPIKKIIGYRMNLIDEEIKPLIKLCCRYYAPKNLLH